jgi:hypothetical protein
MRKKRAKRVVNVEGVFSHYFDSVVFKTFTSRGDKLRGNDVYEFYVCVCEIMV